MCVVGRVRRESKDDGYGQNWTFSSVELRIKEEESVGGGGGSVWWLRTIRTISSESQFVSLTLPELARTRSHSVDTFFPDDHHRRPRRCRGLFSLFVS